MTTTMNPSDLIGRTITLKETFGHNAQHAATIVRAKAMSGKIFIDVTGGDGLAVGIWFPARADELETVR